MTIIDQFDLKAAKFNFSRDYFESVDLLNKAPITNFPDHFITNVAGTLYQLTKANGVWDDSKKTWTVSPWKKLEFGDKNALTTDGNGKIQKNGVDVNELTVTNGNTIVSIEAKSVETDGISVSSFNSGRPGTLILNGEGLRQLTGGSNTKVWTTDGGTVDISGLSSEGAVAAIQAKLAGIDDTVKGYVDSQVKGLAEASDVKTYVDAEVAKAKQVGADASAKVDTAIAALNATVTSDDAAVAKVKVVEAKGKITDVVVTNFGAGVTHTAATESAEANLTAATATGAVVGSDIAKIKSYVDEKSTIVPISETEIADLLK